MLSEVLLRLLVIQFLSSGKSIRISVSRYAAFKMNQFKSFRLSFENLKIS